MLTQSYTIYTDSACDISKEILDSWGVRYKSLSFRFDHLDKEFLNDDMKTEEFYQLMREGHIAKTSAVNAQTFREGFEEELKAGKDVLYLGFSTGLSTTYNDGELAAKELREQYPERKILTVDTLAASAGEGLLVYLAVQKQKEGATIEEVAHFVEDIRLHLCHWFTVEDLVYLKRGGRVSAAVALIGGMLQIKPVLHVDDEGHLISMSKVRGRKASLQALAQHYADSATDKTAPVFISHGDCLEDAKTLGQMIQAAGGPEPMIITPVGPVIGAHSGPGTMALFFLGRER